MVKKERVTSIWWLTCREGLHLSLGWEACEQKQRLYHHLAASALPWQQHGTTGGGSATRRWGTCQRGTLAQGASWGCWTRSDSVLHWLWPSGGVFSKGHPQVFWGRISSVVLVKMKVDMVMMMMLEEWWGYYGDGTGWHSSPFNRVVEEPGKIAFFFSSFFFPPLLWRLRIIILRFGLGLGCDSAE